MVSETDLLLYLALLLGFFSGAFLTWGFLQGFPFLLRPKQKLNQSDTKQVQEYKSLSDPESTITQLHEDQPTYGIHENTQLLEKERQRIAYELHDDTVQRMSAVRLRMEQFSYSLNKPELLEEVTVLQEEMNQIIKSIRLLIWGITLPEFTNKSLTSLLRELVKKLERIIHLDVTFVCRDEALEFFITPETKQSIYRMVQEVTQNFVNHSIGFILSIQVGWEDGLKIIIQDNGQGLIRREHNQELASLQKRAVEIGALLTVKSPIGKGLYLTIELNKPLQ